MKEIELIIGDEELDGVFGMGFVERPAIEKDFIYFNKNKQNFVFGKEIERGIIASPAMIPEKRIYRYDADTNEEYNVFFSVDTVRKLAEGFLFNNHQNNTTEQHEESVNGIHLIFSWIVENQEDPIITKYGFKDIPNGTWCVMYKIVNEDIKEKIKNGEINGISIEAWLTDKFKKFKTDNFKVDELEEDKLEMIKKLLEEMEK